MKVSHMVLPIDLRYTKKEILLQVLNDLSIDMINFNDNIWICDKKTSNSKVDYKGNYSVYFANTPEAYEEWIRYYALSMFRSGSRVMTVENNVRDFKTFLQFLKESYNSIPLNDVDYTVMNKYRAYLNEKYSSNHTKHSKWSAISNFYIKMKGADGYFYDNIVEKNPFSKENIEKESNKYIPKYITQQLDELCKINTLPLEVRVLYWIMRFIPSRIGELFDLPIECIKEIKDGWTLTLNMRKQNGGYFQPELRVIRFKHSSKEAKYLYDLIKAQQEVANLLQRFLEEEKKGYLFTYKKKGRCSVQRDKNGLLKYYEYKDNIIVASYSALSALMKQICEKHNIIDENGKKYHISSHCLRHNGVTDRLIEGSFELDDIKGITHHKSTKMILNNYTHFSEEDILKVQEKVAKVKLIEEVEDGSVYFKGKITNMDEMLERRLLRDIRKHKIKLGICSDISNCKNGYKCLEDCQYYVPDYDDLPYFENEVEQWNRKVEYFKKQNLPMQRENAEYNLKIHLKIRDRLLNVNQGEGKNG